MKNKGGIFAAIALFLVAVMTMFDINNEHVND